MPIGAEKYIKLFLRMLHHLGTGHDRKALDPPHAKDSEKRYKWGPSEGTETQSNWFSGSRSMGSHGSQEP